MVRFREGNKILDFNIAGYEFPNVISKEAKGDYDSNWLICQFVYSDGRLNETYTDACLLTFELEELATSLRLIINGQAESYTSEYLEPYLSIEILKQADLISWNIDFVYDTSDDWKSRQIKMELDTQEAQTILSGILEMLSAFPER